MRVVVGVVVRSLDGDPVGDDGSRDERKRCGQRSGAATTREGGRVKESGAVGGKASAGGRVDLAATLSTLNSPPAFVSFPTNHAGGGRGV